MKKYFYSKFIIVLILLSGCAPKVLVDSYQVENFNPKSYKKIAVLDFSAPDSAKQVSNEIADLVGLELMKMDYQVVERNQIKSILNEHELSMSGVVYDEKRKYILEIAGADIIMLGSIGRYEVTKQFLMMPIYGMGSMGVTVIKASASCTLKLIDINSGKLLWSSSGSLSVNGDNPSVLLKQIVKDCLKDLSIKKKIKIHK